MDTNILIGSLIILIIILGLAVPAIKALAGGWRSWVLAPPPGQFGSIAAMPGRRRWPYMLLCPAIALTMMLPAIWFEAVGNEEMRQLWWKLPLFWAPWLLTIVTFVWWPRWATPRWNRDWEERQDASGDDARVLPFTDAEIAAVDQLPTGSRRRRRLERNIRACKLYAMGMQSAWVPASREDETDAMLQKAVDSVQD